MLRRSRLLQQWQLVLPLALFFAAFVLGPLALLGYVSLHADVSLEEASIAQYTKFLGDGFNLGVLGATLWLGLKVTLLTLLIGYPLAYLYSVSPPRWQGVLMLLIVLPIITVLAGIDPNLRQASLSLGAGSWRTFLRVILPLSAPGVLAGCLLVYASSVSAFVTQTLVGGGQQMFMPFYIYQQAIQANNYPFAAAIAMILLASVLAIVVTMNLLARRMRGVVHG